MTTSSAGSSISSALLVVAALAIFACGGPTPPRGADAGESSSSNDAGGPDAGPDAGAAGFDAGAPGFDAGAVTNPSFPHDFPDPFVLRVAGEFHAYSTNRDVGGTRWNIPHQLSTDLVHWRWVGDALPAVGGWADGSGAFQWAPSVLAQGPTSYVLYYASHRAGTPGQLCVGRAVAATPDGPFVDSWDQPLVCDTTDAALYWSIDPSPFVDADGGLYLLWRQDGPPLGGATSAENAVAIRRLDPTGLSFAAGSAPVTLLSRTPGSWEDPVMENPAMRRVGGIYLVFYSANAWQSASYGIGYGRCASALGPCTKETPSRPWVGNEGARLGPGGEDFFTDPSGALWMSMHGWIAPNVGYGAGGVRALWVYPFAAPGGVPALASP